MRAALPSLRFVAVVGAALGCAVAPPPLSERVASRWIRRSFASPTAYEAFLRAELARARGDWEQAEHQYDLASFADDRDPWIVGRRVRSLVDAGHRERAVVVARAATRLFADDAGTWLLLAEVLEDSSDAAERAAAIARAVALDPADREVRAASTRLAARVTVTDATMRPTATPTAVADRFAREGAWANAARALAPRALRHDASALERVALAVARICAGDAPGARALLARVHPGTGVASRTALAWLAWRAGDAARASEEAALAMVEAESGAAAVRAIALVDEGRLAEALSVAALVLAGDRVPAIAEGPMDPGAVVCAPGPVLGANDDVPGSALALVAATLAAALDEADRPSVADAVLERSMLRLAALGSEGATARDRLRVATLRRALRRGTVGGRPSPSSFETDVGRAAASARVGAEETGAP